MFFVSSEWSEFMLIRLVLTGVIFVFVFYLCSIVPGT